MPLVLGQGVLLACYALATVAAIQLETADLQAIQVFGESDRGQSSPWKSRRTAPRRQRSTPKWLQRKRAARFAAWASSASETAARASGWGDGADGTNACRAGFVALTESECRALASMNREALDGGPMKMVSPTFPSSSATKPRGCYYEDVLGGKEYSFNTHETGAPDPDATPACKTQDYRIGYMVCPVGYVSVNPTECMAAADAYGYVYNPEDIDDDGKPAGCFGQGGVLPSTGTLFFNTASAGSTTAVDTFPFCEPEDASADAVVGVQDLAPPPTGSPTGSPTASPTASPTRSPTRSPTASPTGAPTASPTRSPTAQVAATGDPHMTTISGTKFDILRAGEHRLIHIPQGALAADTLLSVDSVVLREGVGCEDMYIKVLNITGSWAGRGRGRAAHSFVAQSPGEGQVIAPSTGAAGFTKFGIVDLKVVRGKTKDGVWYLNMFARHLREASGSYPVGGILGLDDHTAAATPTGVCGGKKILSLLNADASVGVTEKSVVEVE